MLKNVIYRGKKSTATPNSFPNFEKEFVFVYFPHISKKKKFPTFFILSKIKLLLPTSNSIGELRGKPPPNI